MLTHSAPSAGGSGDVGEDGERRGIRGEQKDEGEGRKLGMKEAGTTTQHEFMPARVPMP